MHHKINGMAAHDACTHGSTVRIWRRCAIWCGAFPSPKLIGQKERPNNYRATSEVNIQRHTIVNTKSDERRHETRSLASSIEGWFEIVTRANGDRVLSLDRDVDVPSMRDSVVSAMNSLMGSAPPSVCGYETEDEEADYLLERKAMPTCCRL